MKNDLMQKVGELLDLAGLDNDVIKAVTEKLADENVVLEGEEEMEVEKVEEAACPIEHEEPEKEAEDEITAPVDPKTNVGGYNAVTEEEFQQVLADFKALKEECARLIAEKVITESEVEGEEVEGEEVAEEAEEATVAESLEVLLSLVQEAYEQTATMKADFEALKEEYARLIAEKVISEACTEDDEVEIEQGEEEDKAENAKEDEKKKESEAQEDEEKADLDKAEGKEKEAEKEEEKAKKHKAEEAKDKKEEDKDYEEAHESLDETADKIAGDVTSITEEAVVPVTKIAKAYSAFTSISESAENTEVKKERKAYTLFPNL